MKQVLIFLIFIAELTSAQSIRDLELKNGFRNFKLGSSPNQIKNITKSKVQVFKNTRITTYDYKGNNIEYIFNVKVNKVSLIFFDNKLCNINIDFGNIFESKNFELFEYYNILGALESSYGTNWANATNSEGVVTNGAIWDGTNIRLELMRVDFSLSKTDPKNYGFITGYINVYDKKIKKEMQSSNF
jgi:hypothetical protein